MSSETLDTVVEKLTQHNIAREKLLAVVEQATTPFQKVHLFNLYDYRARIKMYPYASPSLVIIGKVVALHEHFKWLENSTANEYYFKPVEQIIEKRKLSA